MGEMMLLSSLFERGALPVLQKAMAFAEQRQKVLANNVANFDTIGYKVKDLPVDDFNEALREAVKKRDKRGVGASLEVAPHRHFRYDRSGRLQTRPREIQDNNILFHDQNNRFLEKQLLALDKNSGRHRMLAEMLGQQYNLLRSAIREQV